MESPIQSSFIPRDATKATTLGSGSVRMSGGAADLILMIAIVFVIASAALAGGVFLYKEYLTAARTKKADDLVRMKAQFDPSLIDQLTKLDRRMQAAQDILTQHIAPSAVFDALEASTLTTVSFDNLSVTASDPQHIKIHMTGVAQSVNSIALQAQMFNKSSVITDPIFSAITRQPDGVHFDFQGAINPATLNYAQLANGAAQQQAAASVQPQEPSTVFNNGGGQSGGPSASQGQASRGQ